MMRSFNWLIAEELAGSARPGLLGSLESDLAAIKEQGIKLIVNLMEEPFEPPVSQFGLRGMHFPIQDMGRPSWAHPVVCGGKLFIRNQDSLSCYDIRA